MKIDALKRIIREEVKAAVKEELQDMLNEAVKMASQPQVNNGVDITHAKAPITEQHPVLREMPPLSGMAALLAETKESMSPDEYKNVFQGNTTNAVQKPNFAKMMASDLGLVDTPGQPAQQGNLGDNIPVAKGGSGLDISSMNFSKMKKMVKAVDNKPATLAVQ